MRRFAVALFALALAACGGGSPGSAGSWDGGDWRDRVDPNWQYASVSYPQPLVPDGVATPTGNAGVLNYSPSFITSVEFRDAHGTIQTFVTGIEPGDLWESPLTLPEGNYLIVCHSGYWTYARWFHLMDGGEACELDNGEVWIP